MFVLTNALSYVCVWIIDVKCNMQYSLIVLNEPCTLAFSTTIRVLIELLNNSWNECHRAKSQTHDLLFAIATGQNRISN